MGSQYIVARLVMYRNGVTLVRNASAYSAGSSRAKILLDLFQAVGHSFMEFADTIELDVRVVNQEAYETFVAEEMALHEQASSEQYNRAIEDYR